MYMHVRFNSFRVSFNLFISVILICRIKHVFMLKIFWKTFLMMLMFRALQVKKTFTATRIMILPFKFMQLTKESA